MLAGCADDRHPFERYLSGLRPPMIATVPGKLWPAGTMLCPMTAYQSLLPEDEPLAARVNAYLAQKKFLGEEGRWSLVAVSPAPDGKAGIEHLMFKNDTNYAVLNHQAMIGRAVGALPAGYVLRSCVPVEQGRLLALRDERGRRTVIVFGVESGTH